MKEGFFILLVILVLLVLTVVRYRKQIGGAIGLARALKDAKDAASQGASQRESSSVQLVNCTKCGVWVPQKNASRRGPDFICASCS